jgi:DNA-binding NarL/FixJ family response regulator
MVKEESTSMRVLLVDDDTIFVEYVGYVFQLIDVAIQSATSLSGARRALNESTFDVVLLDNWLPDGKGVELMEEINKLAEAPIVIMTTADEDIDNIKRCFDAGVHDYMIKPIQTDLLIHKVNLLYKNLVNERELAKSNYQLQLAQDAAKAEEELAQHVYSCLVGSSDTSSPGIHNFQLSHGDFCGDFLFTLKADNGNRYVFLADAMGHGLAAAICILPLISIAKAMVYKNMPLLNIVHEINAKLESDLPDDRFVALAALEFNFHSSEIYVVNAGLPGLLVQNTDDEITVVNSSSMPLGVFEPAQFSIQPVVFDIEKTQQIAVFSDGIIEQKNAEGTAIGFEGIKELAEQFIDSGIPWSQIENQFINHLGVQAREDDITLCVMDTPKLVGTHQAPEKSNQHVLGNLDLQISASGEFLKVLDILKLVTNVINESRVESRFANQVFTVLAELYNNALDHGVLCLDSALKNDVMGFAEFLSQREEALNKLNEQDQIDLTLSLRGSDCIELNVADSGDGFDQNEIKDSNGLSGRGLALLNNLAQSIERNAIGNQVKAVMKQQEKL